MIGPTARLPWQALAQTDSLRFSAGVSDRSGLAASWSALTEALRAVTRSRSANVLHRPGGQLTLARDPSLVGVPEDARRRALTAGVPAELTGMASSSVASGLHQLPKDCAADLLVVGSQSRGLTGRVVVGDDTRGSLNGAWCAVAIGPHGYADDPQDIRTIGVAYNDTPEAEGALAVARGFAAAHGVPPSAR